jgi:hypothetical protein
MNAKYLLLLLVTTVGCASAHSGAPVTVSDGSRLGEHIQVEGNSFSKKMSFRDVESSRTVVMKYKGIPVAWSSPINLVVPEHVYEKESRRVRYRFQNPLTAQPMVLLARAKSHRVAGVPLRPEDTEPVVELFAGKETHPRGTLRYDYDTRILFSGQIEDRVVEIERVSADTALDRGVAKYLLFPFPVEGEFVIRVGGREVAQFTQERQHGATSPYDLTLDGEVDQPTREDAMLAFIVFGLMKDFVQNG